MKSFQERKRTSSRVAKDRLKLLLVSERMDCTPQMMIMLRNDILKTVSKYIPIDEKKARFKINQAPPALSVTIPLHKKKDN